MALSSVIVWFVVCSNFVRILHYIADFLDLLYKGSCMGLQQFL